PVAVLLHAARVGGDPAAECRELDAVWLVADREAVWRQLRDDVAADGPGLDARHPVRGIEPEDPVQPPEVDGDDRALLVRAAAERPAHVGAASVGDEADAVANRQRHERLQLLLLRRKDDEVRDTGKRA